MYICQIYHSYMCICMACTHISAFLYTYIYMCLYIACTHIQSQSSASQKLINWTSKVTLLKNAEEKLSQHGK